MWNWLMRAFGGPRAEGRGHHNGGKAVLQSVSEKKRQIDDQVINAQKLLVKRGIGRTPTQRLRRKEEIYISRTPEGASKTRSLISISALSGAYTSASHKRKPLRAQSEGNAATSGGGLEKKTALP